MTNLLNVLKENYCYKQICYLNSTTNITAIINFNYKQNKFNIDFFYTDFSMFKVNAQNGVHDIAFKDTYLHKIDIQDEGFNYKG